MLMHMYKQYFHKFHKYYSNCYYCESHAVGMSAGIYSTFAEHLVLSKGIQAYSDAISQLHAAVLPGDIWTLTYTVLLIRSGIL